MFGLGWLGYVLVILGTFILYAQNYQRIIGKENFKKLTKISKREFRNQADQLALIVDKYIKEYEITNNIKL